MDFGSKENEKFMAMELASKGYVVIAIGYRLADAANFLPELKISKPEFNG
jgi:acetyl esterase/lipase